MVVNQTSPWKTLKDFVADAKARPGAINYGHTGPGGLPHLAAELFMLRSGVKLTGVSYRGGGESANAILANSIQATFENISVLRGLVARGRSHHPILNFSRFGRQLHLRADTIPIASSTTQIDTDPAVLIPAIVP